MKNMQMIILVLLIMSSSVYALQMGKMSARHQQLILVLTPNVNDLHGILQRYTRTLHGQWKKVGTAIPVVVGKNGMAQGNKKEGDGRTPMGVYDIGPAFGFAKTQPAIKLPYVALTDTAVCVDDPQSQYYNRLLDRKQIFKPDWHSGEQMRTVPQYLIGSVIQYNQKNPIKSAGSCIFLHIWKNKNTGTAGCVAMQKSDLKEILQWLNPMKAPVIVLADMAAKKPHQSLPGEVHHSAAKQNVSPAISLN